MAMTDDLRAALNNADRGNAEPLPMLGQGIAHRRNSQPAGPMGNALLVERLPIRRVDVKVEVAAFIDHNFLSRTEMDGTVLHLSRERLIEELTALFCGIEERASETGEQFQKKQPMDRNNSHHKAKQNTGAEQSE